MPDLYSIIVMTGIFAFMCYHGHMLWKEARQEQDLEE